MNSTLSILTAFVGFLVVFSVLVTSVQEALKNWLKLKTGVWEDFFHQLYEKKFKTSKKEEIETSENNAKKEKNFVGEFDEKLQRIYNVVKAADIELKQLADSITAIIENISKEHVISVLRAVQTVKALNLDRVLEIFDKYGDSDLKGLYEKFIDFEDHLQRFLKDTKDSKEIHYAAEIKSLALAIEEKLINTRSEIGQYKINFDLKKDAWLEEIKYNHKRNMLNWTFWIGLAFAVLFNADAFSIYKKLQASPQLQTSLTEQALKLKLVANYASPEDLNAIKDKLTSLQEDSSEVTTQVLKSLQSDMGNFAEQLNQDYKNYGLDQKQLKNLHKNIKNLPSEDQTNQLKSLKDQYEDLAYSYVTFQGKVVNHLSKESTQGLPLGWKGVKETFYASTTNKLWYVFSKLFGLLLTAFLISFGAPFWKNILNALVGVKKITPQR